MSGPSGTESDETGFRRGLGATTGETGVSGDVVARAKAALEDVTEGPWLYIPGGDEEASVISEGEQLPDAITVGGITFNPGYGVAVDLRNGDAAFIAAARSLVPELVAEVERLRRQPGCCGGCVL